jgi:hypothetical protein
MQVLPPVKTRGCIAMTVKYLSFLSFSTWSSDSSIVTDTPVWLIILYGIVDNYTTLRKH